MPALATHDQVDTVKFGSQLSKFNFALILISAIYFLVRTLFDGLNGFISSIQITTDISLLLFSWKAYKSAKLGLYKGIYYWIFISLIPGILSNEAYNVLLYILDANKAEQYGHIWIPLYTLFLIIQLALWLKYIIKIQIKSRRSFLVVKRIYPFLISFITITTSCLLATFYKDTSRTTIYQCSTLNTLLEILIFTTVSISLLKTKYRPLVLFKLGLITLLSFNIAHRFSDSTSVFYHYFDLAWLISLEIILISFILAAKNSAKKIDLHRTNSMHEKTYKISIIYTNIILAVFLTSITFFTSFQIDKLEKISKIFTDIPSALILTYCLSIISGKMFSTSLSRPLNTFISEIRTNRPNISDVLNKKLDEPREVFFIKNVIVRTIKALDKANEIKSNILMNLSHDLRTPASGIFLMSTHLYKILDNESNKNYIDHISNSSKQLMQYIENMLNYCTIELDKVTTIKTKVDVLELIKNIIELMNPMALMKNIHIDFEANSPVLQCLTDEFIIQSVISNLLSNSIKYSKDAKISISAEMTKNQLGYESLIIVVTDGGIGIDPMYHEKIFEPFFQVSESNIERQKGVGLGLSNARLMLEMISGKINVESSSGRGATFFVEIPYTNTERMQAEINEKTSQHVE